MKTQKDSYAGSAVALGTFDGLHRGHMKLIDTLLSQDASLIKILFSFDRPPAVFFGAKEKCLFTVSEKKAAMKRLGVDAVLMKEFDSAMASMKARDFAEMLFETLKAKVVIVGFNYTFGSGAEGSPEMLKEIAQEYGAEVIVCDPVMEGDETVSSTLIRRLIAKGDLEKAQKMLGRNYGAMGVVVRGKQIGRTINFPTINFEIYPEKLYPPEGVYATKVCFMGRELPAMTNIGTRPSIDGDPEVKVETYIFDFDEVLYGIEAEVQFIEFIREVKNFGSKEALREQLEKDKVTARRMLGI